MEKLGINLGYLIMQIVGMSILILILNQFLYAPILKVLEDRKQRINKALEESRQAAIEHDNAKANANKILEAARQEAAKIRSEANEMAQKSAKEMEVKADADAKKRVADAKVAAVEERDRILSEMRNQVAAISIAAANKLVGEALDEQRQRALLNEFFAKVPASVSSLSGTNAEVTSALPLNDDEKAAARGAVKASNVTFKVDPSILGGVIVRVDDQIVDSSVASKMSGLRDSMMN